MKKILSLLMILGLALNASPALAKMKIGILTGTTSQGEDEFRAAEQVSQKYPGQVIHLTYPDNFMQEQETVISNITSMASDKDVKAILIGQGVPGTVPGIKKAKRLRPDLVFVIWNPHEDPKIVHSAADLVFDKDDISRGKSLPQLAKKLGAKKFIHYSFPRHMSYKTLSDRRDIMIEECKKIGVEFIFASMPDPTAEGGIAAAQQFILEDVGRQIKKHGKDTAFFSTNDAATDPLVQKVAEMGAIFTEPDVPSPTMGYPGGLGLKIPPEKAGDFDFINEEIKKAVAKAGNTGRMANWPRPSSIVAIKAAADLLFDTKADKSKVQDRTVLSDYLSKQAGVAVKLTPYGDLDHYNMILMDSIIY